MKKILKIFVLLLVLLAIGAIFFVKSNQPQYSGALKIKNLTEDVNVYFDDFGIPHIYANNNKDAYLALGYLHAQDRLWQMELLRRIASGRLSEILGEELIETDKFFRGLGVEKAAEKSINKLDTTSQFYQFSMAYLDGINQYIENGITPIEFRLAGIDKEKYTIKDIYNVFGYMAFGFAQAHRTDPLLTNIKNKLGDAYLLDLGIKIDPKTMLIENYSKKSTKNLANNISASVNDILDNSPISPFIGSNSWVIGHKKTKNKKVIFSNDPHIGFSQPAVWYQSHLVTPDYEIYGFNLGLTPFPLLGHNRNYAYGLTMFENDDIDFYEIHESKSLESRTEIIKVKGSDDIEFEVQESEYGPIINDLVDGIDSEVSISMDWIYTKLENNLLEVCYNMSHANSLKDFKKGASLIHAPGLNIMYGDSKNNIAWFAAAKLFSRPSEVNPKFILNSSNEHDVKLDYFDFAQNPQAINPPWNYVYSANNQPDKIKNGYYPGYYLAEDRARRIVELLEAKNDFTQSDIELMVNDIQSSVIPELIPVISDNLSKVNLSSNEKKALQILEAWEGNYEMNEIAPAIYNKFIFLMLKNTFKDEMGEEMFDGFLETHLYKRQIAKQIKMRKSVWWNDITTKNIKENRDEIFTNSFHETVSALENQFGDDLSKWKWSKAISVTHKHAFDKVTGLRSFFNVGPFETNGGNEVLNNQLFSINNEGVYDVSGGPSTRRVIDFSDIENAVSILPTGQSGNVFSKHYKDQAQKYLKGEFIIMKLNHEEIKRSKDKLVLTSSNE